MLVLRRRLRHRGSDGTPTRRTGRPVITRVSGDRSHPANLGRLCTKGATHAELMRADDGRLKSALLRPGSGDELVPTPVDDAVAEAGRRLRAIVDGTVPTPSRSTSRARCRSRRSTWPTSWPRVFCGPCTSSRTPGCAWPARAPGTSSRWARTAHRVPTHDFDCTRTVFRHRLEHGRLPPHPVPADDRPAQGGRQADRRRPAAHRHRREGRPLPADQAPAPIWRCSTVCCTCWSRTATSTHDFIAEHTEGWEAMPAFLADYPPHRVAEITGISRKPTSAPPRG